MTRPRTDFRFFFPMLLCASLLASGCGGEPSGGDEGTPTCREQLDADSCNAITEYMLPDGSPGRCQWHEGSVYERSGNSCSTGSSAGACLAMGSTQFSCTYTAMNQTYPSCEGSFGENDVPPIWVATNAGETILLEGICGPTIVDEMSGRCGRSESDDAPECECPCL